MTAESDERQLAEEVNYLFRVAYRLTGDTHDAEDLVQDVCERALNRAPDFASSADCRRWLLRVLFNRFVDDRRHRHRSPVVESSTGIERHIAAPEDMPGPEGLAVQADAEKALTRAWERLEPVQQVLLMLRAEGHDLSEMAEISGIEKPALSSRLHRARSSLARYLQEESLAPPLRVISEKRR